MKKQLSALFALVLCMALSVGILPVPASAAAEKKPSVTLTNQRLIVNGKEVKIEVYNIDGNNYFKLRDIAMLLNGTISQFGITVREFYKPSKYARTVIHLASGNPYQPVGGELVTGVDKSATAVLNEQLMTIDSSDRRFKMYPYNIGGNNFFKLRDLAGMFYFDVDYDGKTNTVTITTRDPATAKVIGWDESNAKANSIYEGFHPYEGEKEGFWFNDFIMQYKLGSGPKKPGEISAFNWADEAVAAGFEPDYYYKQIGLMLFEGIEAEETPEEHERYLKGLDQLVLDYGYKDFDHDWWYYYPEYD